MPNGLRSKKAILGALAVIGIAVFTLAVWLRMTQKPSPPLPASPASVQDTAPPKPGDCRDFTVSINPFVNGDREPQSASGRQCYEAGRGWVLVPPSRSPAP